MNYKYTFNVSSSEESLQDTTLSVKHPIDASPEEVLESFITFLEVVYGWDVRERLENYLGQ